MACVREKRLEMVFLDGFVCKTLVESTLGFILIHQLDYFSYVGSPVLVLLDGFITRTIHFHLLLPKAFTNEAHACFFY